MVSAIPVPAKGYMYRLAKESTRMLKATVAGDVKTMCDVLTYAHNTEIPLLSYSNETDLAAVINLVYLSARDTYRVEREDKAGTGYVDFIFYPELDRNADCIILELKVDHTADDAIQQIKDRQYHLKFQGNNMNILFQIQLYHDILDTPSIYANNNSLAFLQFSH